MTTPGDLLDLFADLTPNPRDRDYANAVIAAGWRPPARTITTVDELAACHDFAVLHWTDDAGLPHAFIAVQMKEHVTRVGKLFGEQMWPMTVLHDGGDE